MTAYYSATACTTFFINKNGQMVFGRNYDWVTDAGMVCTNLRGLSKTSMKTAGGGTINWVSQYGSITFNQYGKEFPTGGMNEKGLVVELMWLDETKYPKADSRPAVDVLQWVQYQLDNCATIEEVIATDKKIRIAGTGNAPLHYLIADAKGNAATIEFLEGKMVLHTGKDLPLAVLTNDTYKKALHSSYIGSNNSLERFHKACTMLNKFETTTVDRPITDYAFDMLAEVAQGNFTKWSIVYDITNKTIHFKTNRFNEVKQVSFSSFDLSCKPVSKVWDMNQKANGNINKNFEDFNEKINRRIVETAFKESKEQINVPDKVIESVWRYAGSIRCQ
ncbi:MAG TPA: linear amide C-N hydrolase [Chitinophagaceae bacterium]